MRAIGTIVSGLILIGLMVLGYSIIFALPTMWLWNWLMPSIFGLMKINFFQSMGLLILSGLLVKSSSSRED